MINSSKSFLKKLEKGTTKGFVKLQNYFEEVVKSERFQQGIKNLRNKYSIPKNGFVFDPKNPYLPPKNWKYKNDAVKFEEMTKEIRNLSEKFDLYESSWDAIIWDYVFYNETFLNKHLLYSYDLCFIEDVPEQKEDLNHPDYKDIFKEAEKKDSQGFPVAIRISPYAGERDILDFIKKNYKYINRLQKKYQKENIKIGRIRSKSPKIKKRNQFIYEHRQLNRKKLMRLVNKKFGGFEGSLDYGNIGKIISLEKKRRKEL